MNTKPEEKHTRPTDRSRTTDNMRPGTTGLSNEDQEEPSTANDDPQQDSDQAAENPEQAT